MANRRAYFERDGRGRERLVVRQVNRGRSVSRGRQTTTELRDLLYESEARTEQLKAENEALQTRLNFAGNAEWELQRLKAEHHGCRNLQAQLEAQVRAARNLEETLYDERDDNKKLEHKIEKLEERLRLMKRGSGEGSYRARYDQAVADADAYRDALAQKIEIIETKDSIIRSRDDEIRIANARIAEKKSTINKLRDYLESRGYRVEFI